MKTEILSIRSNSLLENIIRDGIKHQLNNNLIDQRTKDELVQWFNEQATYGPQIMTKEEHKCSA